MEPARKAEPENIGINVMMNLQTDIKKPVMTNNKAIFTTKASTKFFVTTFLFIFYFIFTSCNTNDKIEGLKSNEIIVITVNLEIFDRIEKITLVSKFGRDSLIQEQIGDKRRIKLKCPMKGEGVYNICVYTEKDTICSNENYAEGGYRPVLKLKEKKIEFENFF